MSDAGARSTSVSYTIRVISRPEPSPVLRCPARTTGVGVSYSSGLSINATGNVTFSIADGSLPSGFTLNPSTGAISGVAGPLTFSTFFPAALLPSGQTVVAECSIVAVEGPVVDPSALCIDQRDFVVGEAVATLVPGHGTFRPTNIDLYQTTLPPGLTLSPNGLVTGTPTTPGNRLVAFRASDGSSDFFSTTPLCPVTVSVPVLTLLTPSPLPGAIVGQPYSLQLSATGGVAPRSFSTASSGLPPGLTLSSNGLLSGTPSVAGSFSFSVNVSDATEQSVSRSYVLVVLAPNPLRFGPQLPPPGTVGVPYSHDFDISGGTPPYSVQLLEGGVPGLSLVNGRLTGTPTTASGWPLSVGVRDAAGASLSGSFVVNVSQGAFRLGCPAFSGEIGATYRSTPVVFGGVAPYQFRIADGTLPAGLSLNPSSGEVSGQPTQLGASTFTLSVRDAGNLSTASRCSIGIVSGVLRLLTSGPIRTVAGRDYTGAVEAAGGQPPYFFAVVGSTAPGLNLAGNGSLGGRAARVGDFGVVIRVTDASGATAQRSVLFQNSPNEMRFSCPLPDQLQVGVAAQLSFLVEAGVSPYQASLASGTLPPGAALGNPNLAGLATFSALPTEPGNFAFRLQVVDGTNTVATRDCSIRVSGTPLSITTDSLPEGSVGSAYAATVATSGGVEPVRVSVSGGELPPGVSLDASTGALAGTPLRAGLFSADFEASDRPGQRVRRALAIRVEDANLPLTLATVSPLADGVVGRVYNQGFEAEGGRPPYSFSLAGSLPAGLSFSGSLSGTPTVTGEFPLTVSVRDEAGASATKDFLLRVVAEPALTILTETLPDGVTSQAYSPLLSALGGTPPYRWALLRGRLPAGVSFNSAGAFSGTPTSTGQFEAAVLVEDEAGAVFRRAYRFEVRTPGTDRLEITTATLPPVNVGVVYGSSLAARGGQAPYRWSVRGALPAGITLSEDGQLAGMVATVGNSRFVVVVSDALGLSATREFSLPVTASVAPTAALTGLPETLGANASAPFALTVSRPLAVATNLRLTLRFIPDPIHNTDDVAVRFGNQTRTIDVLLPAQATSISFPAGAAAVSSGTLAGSIVISSEYNVGGGVLPGPGATITIRRAPPVISALRLNRSGGNLEIRVEGFTNTRQLGEARVTFTFASGVDVTGSNSATINVASAIQAWFASAASVPFGGQFGLTLPFNVAGDAANITSVAVVLTNGEGASSSVSSQ